ncbi:MAG: hypothetical protein R3C32_00885 [Chloroflexota bacterium]
MRGGQANAGVAPHLPPGGPGSGTLAWFIRPRLAVRRAEGGGLRTP